MIPFLPRFLEWEVWDHRPQATRQEGKVTMTDRNSLRQMIQFMNVCRTYIYIYIFMDLLYCNIFVYINIDRNQAKEKPILSWADSD